VAEPLAKNQFLDDKSFDELQLPALQTNIEDIRPVDQVNVVLFDNSSSMQHEFSE
jgi:hypothetical protein